MQANWQARGVISRAELLLRESWAQFLVNPVKLLAPVAAVTLGLTLGVAVQASQRMSTYQLALLVSIGLVLFAVMVADIRGVLLIALGIVLPIGVAFTPFNQPGTDSHAGGAWSTFVLYPYDFPLLGLSLLFLMDWLVHKRRPARPLGAIDLFGLAFIAWAGVSMLNSVNLALSGFEILRMAKLYLLFLVVVAMVRTMGDLRRLIVALLIGLMLQSIFGILQYTGTVQYGVTVGEERRVAGTLGWPNTFGAYAAVLVAVAFSLWISGVSGRLRGIAAIMSLVGLAPLVLSFSRGAWVSIMMGCALAFFLARRRGWMTTRTVAKLSVALVVLAGAAISFADTVLSRLLQTNLQESQITTRLDLNQVALAMATDHPWAGVGINTFVEVMGRYDSTGITSLFPEPVHNVFLLIAAETGWIGLAFFLMLIGAALRHGFAAMAAKDRFLSAVAIGGITGLSLLLITNLADVHLRTDFLYALFWLLIGVLVVARRLASLSEAREVLPNGTGNPHRSPRRLPARYLPRAGWVATRRAGSPGGLR